MRIPLSAGYFQVIVIFHGNVWKLEQQRNGRLVWTKKRRGTTFSSKSAAAALVGKAPKKGRNLPHVADNWARIQKA